VYHFLSKVRFDNTEIFLKSDKLEHAGPAYNVERSAGSRQ